MSLKVRGKKAQVGKIGRFYTASFEDGSRDKGMQGSRSWKSQKKCVPPLSLQRDKWS